MMKTYIRNLFFRLFSYVFGSNDKLFSLLDSAVVSLGRFAAGITLAKLAGAEAFGQYLLLITAGFFFLSIPSTLFITPMVNLASGLPLAERRSVLAWTHRRLKTGFLFATALAVLAFPLARYYTVEPAFYIGFCCATLAWLELLYQRACMQSLFRMKSAFVADAIGFMVLVLIVGVATVLFDSPISGFWWGSAFASSLSSLLMRGMQPDAGEETADRPVPDPSPGLQKRARSSGKAMLVGSLANSACSKVQPFILGSVGGLMTVASFGAAWTLIGPLRMFSSALSGILRPRLAMHRYSGNRKAFYKSLNTGYSLVGLMGVAGILISAFTGPALIELLFGPSLRQAGWFLPLAMAYATLDVITTIQMIALQTGLKNGVVLASRLRVTAAVFSLLLIYPACLFCGSWGAFGSLLLAETLYLFGASKALHINSKTRRETDCMGGLESSRNSPLLVTVFPK